MFLFTKREWVSEWGEEKCNMCSLQDWQNDSRGQKALTLAISGGFMNNNGSIGSGWELKECRCESPTMWLRIRGASSIWRTPVTIRILLPSFLPSLTYLATLVAVKDRNLSLSLSLSFSNSLFSYSHSLYCRVQCITPWQLHVYELSVQVCAEL